MHDRSDFTTDSGLAVPAPRGISRRRVVGTAAWAAPAIVVAGAVPAFAYSGATSAVIGGFAATRGAFSGPPFFYWSSGTSGYTQRTTTPGTVQTNSQLNLAITGITTTGGAGTGTVTIAVTVPSNNTDSNRASGQVGSVSTGWSSVGTPTINTTTRFVTYTFVSLTNAVGDVLPDLNFSVTNSSNSGNTVYTWNAGLTVTLSATASSSTAPPTTTPSATTV